MSSELELQPRTLPILVVEDDPDVARFVKRVLMRAGHEAVLAVNAGEAERQLASRSFSMMLSDVRMPGTNGLDLLASSKRQVPDMPVILMTAYGAMEDAIAAFRCGADDFLLKPLTVESLSQSVEGAICVRKGSSRRVLAIGAHPDDVEIGVGGTVLGHSEAGDSVTILTLSKGANGGCTSAREAESRRAAELLSATLILGDLPDTRLGEIRSAVTLIETAIGEIRPDIVYTHTYQDVHQDHRAAHEASLIACRRVPCVYCYQPPSATVDFAPCRFMNIDGFVDRKLAAIAVYETQTSKNGYLAEDLTRATARYWGRFCQAEFAEPLEVVRENVEVQSESASTSTATREPDREEVHV